MTTKFVTYKAVSENADIAFLFVCIPYLPGGNDPLPVPFFGPTEEEAKHYASQFVLEELTDLVGKDGLVQ